MSERYRTCQNCGASLAAGQTYCPRCGAPYVEPVIQQPGEFEPFPPEQQAPPNPAGPYGAQQPVAPPPSQPGTPYPPQRQSYVPPPAPSSYPSGGYGQQEQMAAGQVGGPPEPPASQTGQGLRVSLIIGAVVLLLLLLGGVGGLFYYLGQHNSATPATTPTPGITPTPTPTPGITPTPTPGITPTPTPSPASFGAPATDMRASQLTIHNASGSAVPLPVSPW